MDIENGLAVHFSEREQAAIDLQQDEAEAGVPVDQLRQRIEVRHQKIAGILDAGQQVRFERFNLPLDPVALHEADTCLQGLDAQLGIHHLLSKPAEN